MNHWSTRPDVFHPWVEHSVSVLGISYTKTCRYISYYRIFETRYVRTSRCSTWSPAPHHTHTEKQIKITICCSCCSCLGRCRHLRNEPCSMIVTACAMNPRTNSGQCSNDKSFCLLTAAWTKVILQELLPSGGVRKRETFSCFMRDLEHWNMSAWTYLSVGGDTDYDKDGFQFPCASQRNKARWRLPTFNKSKHLWVAPHQGALILQHGRLLLCDFLLALYNLPNVETYGFLNGYDTVCCSKTGPTRIMMQLWTVSWITTLFKCMKDTQL